MAFRSYFTSHGVSDPKEFQTKPLHILNASQSINWQPLWHPKNECRVLFIELLLPFWPPFLFFHLWSLSSQKKKDELFLPLILWNTNKMKKRFNERLLSGKVTRWPLTSLQQSPGKISRVHGQINSAKQISEHHKVLECSHCDLCLGPVLHLTCWGNLSKHFN